MGNRFMEVLQFIYGSSEIVPILGLDAWLIIMPKVPQSSFMQSIQCFFGGRGFLCLIECTPPGSAIFRHLLSFILMVEVSQVLSL